MPPTVATSPPTNMVERIAQSVTNTAHAIFIYVGAFLSSFFSVAQALPPTVHAEIGLWLDHFVRIATIAGIIFTAWLGWQKHRREEKAKENTPVIPPESSP